MSSSCTNDGDKPRACVKPYDQIEAVEWRRDWKVLPAMLLATLVLLAWLAAAACVSQKHTILPLTHFKTAYHGLLGNGNYNTLVAVAGGVAGATVCFGISQAIKDLLRKEMLSLGGISLAKYTTLVKLANQAVDLRWHVTALFPLILFTTINLFGAATQAAFGVAVEYYNISTPFPLMRLSDNGDVMSLFLDATRANIGKVQILFSGELKDALQTAATALSPGNHGAGWVNVEKVSETITLEGPVLSFLVHTGVVNLRPGILRELNLTSGQIALLQANSGSNVAFAPTEGFTTGTTCRSTSVQMSATPLTEAFVQYSYILPDCTEDSTAIYDRSLSTAFDAYACQDGSSNIYIFGIQPSVSLGGATWVCHVDSLRSSMYRGILSQKGYFGSFWGPPSGTTNIEHVGDLVAYSGSGFWNAFGPGGSPELMSCWDDATANQIDFTRVLEWATAAITSMVTAKVADYLSDDALTLRNYTGSPASPRKYTTEVRLAEYRVQALKLHLAGSQIAWIVLPIVLLLLMLWLITVDLRRNHRTGGQIDLTDPCTVLLVAGAGPEEPLWRGASTGQFADRRERESLRINYGVDIGNEDRLVLTGSADMIAGRPALGHRYK